MGTCLAGKGYRLVTGGTDNHQVVVDLGNTSLTGSRAEKILEASGIVLNRNVVPRDALTPKKVSGVRIGTGAMAARGMGENEAEKLVDLMDSILKFPDDTDRQIAVRAKVEKMCGQFPVYKNTQQ